MKRNLFGLFMLLILAAFAQAQTTPTPVDCQFSATFTVSTLTTASYYNRGPSAPCIAWRLTYSTLNATAVSISLQGTVNLPNGQPDPAGWTNLTTPTGSTNPATGVATGTIASCCDYYPWIRVTAGTFTGTGQTMSLTVLGYKGTSASRNTGGGGVTSVTGSSPIISSSGLTPIISLDKTLVAQKFFGATAPGPIAGNLPGDLFTDTTGHLEYVCNAPFGTAAPACTTVAAAEWLLLNSGSTYTLPTATDLILGGVTMSTSTSSVAVATDDPRNSNARLPSAGTVLVAQKFFGTAAPGSVATNLPGDLYTDTTAHKEYACNAPAGTAAPACTTVAAAEWLLLNAGGASIAHVTQTLKGDGAGNAVGIGASDIDCVHPDGSSGTCVPYTGATADVNLGTHSETLNNITINGTCSGTGCPTGPAGPAGPAGPSGPAGPTTHTLNLSINGNGAPITAGSQGFTYAPAACTIGTWTILADVAGNIAIDLKRSTYAVFPTNASIVGAGNPPTLASVQKNQAAAASWTSTAILAGDVIEFVVSAPSLVTQVNLTVECN